VIAAAIVFHHSDAVIADVVIGEMIAIDIVAAAIWSPPLGSSHVRAPSQAQFNSGVNQG
jgi:hypothetical protein